MKFPDEEIVLPDDSEMPFPPFEVKDDMELSEILENAMETEKACLLYTSPSPRDS